MCGRGRAVGGSRYLNFVRAACEVGPTRHAGGVACRRVTVRGRSNSNSNSRDEAGVKAAVLTHLSCDLKNKGAAGGRQQLYAVIRRHVTVVPLCWKLGSLGGTNTEALAH